MNKTVYGNKSMNRNVDSHNPSYNGNGLNHAMSIQAIMLQKGSKCKCKISNQDDMFKTNMKNRANKNEEDGFDEISMNSS